MIGLTKTTCVHLLFILDLKSNLMVIGQRVLREVCILNVYLIFLIINNFNFSGIVYKHS